MENKVHEHARKLVEKYTGTGGRVYSIHTTTKVTRLNSSVSWFTNQ